MMQIHLHPSDTLIFSCLLLVGALYLLIPQCFVHRHTHRGLGLGREEVLACAGENDWCRVNREPQPRCQVSILLTFHISERLQEQTGFCSARVSTVANSGGSSDTCNCFYSCMSPKHHSAGKGSSVHFDAAFETKKRSK